MSDDIVIKPTPCTPDVSANCRYFFNNITAIIAARVVSIFYFYYFFFHSNVVVFVLPELSPASAGVIPDASRHNLSKSLLFLLAIVVGLLVPRRGINVLNF